MTDLSELRVKAEAVQVAEGWYALTLANGSDVRARHASGGSTWIAECRTNENAAYIAAASPDVVLRLVAIAEAAQAWTEARGATQMHARTLALREALEGLEPQGRKQG